MIKKETFINTMNLLTQFAEEQSNLDAAIKLYSHSENMGIFTGLPFMIALNLLKEIFNDEGENSLLEYLVIEKNLLADYKDGDIRVDGENIDCSSWDKVYDVLLSKIKN